MPWTLGETSSTAAGPVGAGSLKARTVARKPRFCDSGKRVEGVEIDVVDGINWEPGAANVERCVVEIERRWVFVTGFLV